MDTLEQTIRSYIPQLYLPCPRCGKLMNIVSAEIEANFVTYYGGMMGVIGHTLHIDTKCSCGTEQRITIPNVTKENR